jgi:hypothetical protein
MTVALQTIRSATINAGLVCIHQAVFAMPGHASPCDTEPAITVGCGGTSASLIAFFTRATAIDVRLANSSYAVRARIHRDVGDSDNESAATH